LSGVARTAAVLSTAEGARAEQAGGSTAAVAVCDAVVLSRAAHFVMGMQHIIGMPLHIIMHGIPMLIMDIIISQQFFIMSICEASIGVILQTMPSLVISQLMRQVIMGIGIPPIIGIMPFIIGIPPIIGIMPFIGIPFIIG
jgi:hypothetical protein